MSRLYLTVQNLYATKQNYRGVMKYIIGFVAGIIVTCSIQANAGMISHVAAYEIGKHNGKSEAKEDCKCPDKGH